MSASKRKLSQTPKRSMMDEINLGLNELAGQLAEYVTLLRDNQDGSAADNR